MLSTKRVQFDMYEDRLARIDQLVKAVGFNSRRDYFDDALTMFEWIIEETKKGNVVSSVNEESGVYNPVVITSLFNFKKRLETPKVSSAVGHSTPEDNSAANKKVVPISAH